MISTRWLMLTLSLFLALTLFVLLFPPWSPLSISRRVPETLAPAQPSSKYEDHKAAFVTLHNPGSEDVQALTNGRETVKPVEQIVTSESPKDVPEVLTGQRSDDATELIKATEHSDWRVRWDAVNSLGVLQDPRAIPALLKRALYDDNPHPRWRSLWALTAVDRDGSRAIPLLRPALHDSDPTVVRNAAIALAFFAQPEARPYLLEGLKNADSYRRWEAIFSLRNVGDPEVAKALLPLLSKEMEPEPGIRGEAALAIGDTGDRSAVPALLDVLRRDSSPEVRWRAGLAISKLGDTRFLDELKQMLSTEQDPQVRQFLGDAIAQLQR